MNYFTKAFIVILALLSVIKFNTGAPVENTSLTSGSDAKSAFGQAFDEIVVESTLNVKRKGSGRQSRNNQPSITRTKRQHGFPYPSLNFPNYGDSVAAASAQAQSHQAQSPFGNFGASASGSQSQSLAFGPKGPFGSASFAGSQQYMLPNGETINIAFGNSIGNSESNKAGGATISISSPKR
ncbi:uncharacterized protein LOC115875931 [Sitophilus oryzae]|uniref:Uncharacterized protein LOC115875931 n=1 Tax=Sitophilus oryzae TaxID=7048 RepID=A0A6J2X822_SITOR|nr:uncharacterized protein LOC115875931 [Sitophilus oryzae]